MEKTTRSTKETTMLLLFKTIYKPINGDTAVFLEIRGDCDMRKLRLAAVILSSCFVGLLIGVYTDVAPVASTIKRLVGNQIMTVVYRTDTLLDQTGPLTRSNLSRHRHTRDNFIERNFRNENLDQIASNLVYYSHMPLLTMFTTFKNVRGKFQIHRNLLYNWAVFKPHVLPVLFDTGCDPDLVDIALELGWKVIKFDQKSRHGVPFLKPMFEIVQAAYNSTFYGYSNGDLLFDSGLINTLSACGKVLPLLGQTLVVGQRHNFPCQNETLYKPSEVAYIARTKGKLFRTDAEDYFIISNGTFPWSGVKHVVVGRPGYDNYLVSFAIQNGVSVVDASKTLLALHQSGRDGDRAGFFNRDSGYNYKEIGIFNYDGGYTSHAQLETRFNSSGNIDVWRRN